MLSDFLGFLETCFIKLEARIYQFWKAVLNDDNGIMEKNTLLGWHNYFVNLWFDPTKNEFVITMITMVGEVIYVIYRQHEDTVDTWSVYQSRSINSFKELTDLILVRSFLIEDDSDATFIEAVETLRQVDRLILMLVTATDLSASSGSVRLMEQRYFPVWDKGYVKYTALRIKV